MISSFFKYFIILLTFLGSSSVANAIYQKPNDAVLKQKLNSMQYYVTQQKGTEPAYHNAYWDNKKQGIYVDIVSGEPLFSSVDKYDSQTGWPSFTKPIDSSFILTQVESGWFFNRTEVHSKIAHSHLGHMFNDGPAPTYKRYCLNSAALKFIPIQDMQKEGYGQYLYLFQPKQISK